MTFPLTILATRTDDARGESAGLRRLGLGIASLIEVQAFGCRCYTGAMPLTPIPPPLETVPNLAAKRRWWRQVLPGASVIERQTLFDRWLAGAVQAILPSGAMSLRWFQGRAIASSEAGGMAPPMVLALGEFWQSVGTIPDKVSGQWFTPTHLVVRLLDQWAGDWLTARVTDVRWDGEALQGSLTAARAAEILRAWCALRVVDPAMGAGDWLCGWVLLHRRMGTALADRC
ncbi:MAG: hypothetical protein H7338_18600, partial [Candidatus Sericytochromatia bacterium]|nr:hypothetical protein [Candidatus Sericytochromatia bacterium]